MAGIRIKVVDVKAKLLLKAAVLWIYDDPSQESDVSIVNLKNLFEEEVLKDVTEFDPKSPPKSVSEASIILNEKIYIGKWTEKGVTSFHKCKVLKISEKTTELNKFVKHNTLDKNAETLQLNSKRKRIASKRALEMDDGKVVKEKGKNKEKENQPPEKKKKSNETHQDQGQQDQGQQDQGQRKKTQNESQDQGQKKKTQKQSLKLAKLMAERNINSELLNKWIPGEGKENQQSNILKPATNSSENTSYENNYTPEVARCDKITHTENNQTEKSMRSNISFSLNSSCQSITSSQSRNDSSALSPIYPPQYPTSLAQQHHNPSYNTSPANQQVNVLSNTQVQQPAHADQMYPPTTKPVNFEAPQHYNTIPNNPTQPQFHWPLGNHHLPHQPPQTHLEYLLDEEEPIIPRTKSLPGASRSFHTNNFGSLFKNTTELLINNTDTTKDDEINHPNQIDRDVASGEESVADNENCERCKQLEEENNRLKQKIFSFEQEAATSKHQISVAMKALSTIQDLQPCHASSPVSAFKNSNSNPTEELQVRLSQLLRIATQIQLRIPKS